MIFFYQYHAYGNLVEQDQPGSVIHIKLHFQILESLRLKFVSQKRNIQFELVILCFIYSEKKYDF